MATEDKAAEGHFKARAIAGTEQFGFAGQADTPQIGINMEIQGPLGPFVMTTILFCSPEAWPYSAQRLQMLGWKGKSASDLANLTGLTEEVEVDVTKENYQGKLTWRCQISTGPGAIVFSKTTDRASFASRVAMLVGNTGAGGGAPQGDLPPF